MDKFNALLNTFNEAEQKKENERLAQEAKEKEKKALKIAFEEERKCGLTDLTEEFFYGFADFLGIREKVGSDLLLEQQGDLSRSQYSQLFANYTSISETISFNKLLITLNIRDKSFHYPLFIEQAINESDIYYGLYLKRVTKEQIELFNEAKSSKAPWYLLHLAVTNSVISSSDDDKSGNAEEKLRRGFALISSTKAEQAYQRKNEDWQPIFEKILADFQLMIKTA